jgi:hypothetical protein
MSCKTENVTRLVAKQRRLAHPSVEGFSPGQDVLRNKERDFRRKAQIVADRYKTADD